MSGTKLPEIPFRAGIVLWAACAVAFCVADEMHQAWSWLAWVPIGVILCMATARSTSVRVHKRSCQREGARAALALAYPEPDWDALAAESRERLVRTGELQEINHLLDTALEAKIAVGALTGCPPSEIHRFLVLAIDADGKLNVASSCCKHETDYLLHTAHEQLIGSER